MKFFILCFAATLLNALAAPGFPAASKDAPAECADPTFSCRDLKSARSCGVVTACIHDVWSITKAPADNDQICDICKEMVKEARDQLLSNMTQEELKEVFEGSCKLLPVKLIADACLKLVDEFIPELVETLASRMDPNMVCTVSGLCYLTKQSVENAPKRMEPVHDELVCEFCTHVLQHVKDLVTANTTVDEFRTALQNFCKHTGSFSSKCTDFVNEYFDTIFGYIQSMDPKGFCTIISLCTSGYKHPAQRISQSNDVLQTNELQENLKQLSIDKCELCTTVVDYLDKLLEEDDVDKEITQVIEKVCSALPSSVKDKCTVLIETYGAYLLQMIGQLANSQQVCQAIDVCPSSFGHAHL